MPGKEQSRHRGKKANARLVAKRGTPATFYRKGKTRAFAESTFASDKTSGRRKSCLERNAKRDGGY